MKEHWIEFVAWVVAWIALGSLVFLAFAFCFWHWKPSKKSHPQAFISEDVNREFH